MSHLRKFDISCGQMCVYEWKFDRHDDDVDQFHVIDFCKTTNDAANQRFRSVSDVLYLKHQFFENVKVKLYRYHFQSGCVYICLQTDCWICGIALSVRRDSTWKSCALNFAYASIRAHLCHLVTNIYRWLFVVKLQNSAVCINVRVGLCSLHFISGGIENYVHPCWLNATSITMDIEYALQQSNSFFTYT